jgi:hypothetical protein
MKIQIDEANYWATMELVEDFEEPIFVVNKCFAIIEGLQVDITGAVICDAPLVCERLEKRAMEKWKAKG